MEETKEILLAIFTSIMVFIGGMSAEELTETSTTYSYYQEGYRCSNGQFQILIREQDSSLQWHNVEKAKCKDWKDKE